MDDVLDILHCTGPEFGSNLANHGPMAAEALLAMGHPDAVLPWVERYKSCLQDHPESTYPISPQHWREALGHIARLGDWVAFFDRQLAEVPCQDVIRCWVPRFAPALIAAGAHGLIRTSHAVRSLADRDTLPRRHELAEGLGFWAARYRVFPGTPSEGSAGYGPRDGLARVPRLHGPGFAAHGLIGQELRGLDRHAWFPEIIDLVRTGGAPCAFLSQLTEVCTEIYLAQPKHLVAFIHAVTAPSAHD